MSRRAFQDLHTDGQGRGRDSPCRDVRRRRDAGHRPGQRGPPEGRRALGRLDLRPGFRRPWPARRMERREGLARVAQDQRAGRLRRPAGRAGVRWDRRVVPHDLHRPVDRRRYAVGRAVRAGPSRCRRLAQRSQARPPHRSLRAVHAAGRRPARRSTQHARRPCRQPQGQGAARGLVELGRADAPRLARPTPDHRPRRPRTHERGPHVLLPARRRARRMSSSTEPLEHRGSGAARPTVRVTLTAPDGTVTTGSARSRTLRPGERARLRFTVPVEGSPQLWSPEAPRCTTRGSRRGSGPVSYRWTNARSGCARSRSPTACSC